MFAQSRIILPAAVFFLLIFSAASAPAGTASFLKQVVTESPDSFVPGEYIVKFKPGVRKQDARSLADENDGVAVRELLNPRTWLFRFNSKGGRDAVLARIKKRRDVEYAEPNGRVRAFYLPHDPLYRAGRQWNFGQLNVSRAWNYSRGEGAVVAVIDTGVAKQLSDFRKTRFVRGYDFVNRDRFPFDDNGHGSHVAGTIAQSTNNRLGTAGIAFRAKIMPIKVLDAGGFGTFSDVADGIRWAANHGAHVINLSLGSSSHSNAMKEAVDYARYRKDAVVVAAAGNSGAGRLSYPAAYPGALAVTATDYNRNLTWYSSWGNGTALAAPGGDTSVDLNGDGYPDGILQQTGSPSRPVYKYYQGTSMAAPHVAGVAALVRSRSRKGPRYIINALKYSARDLGAPGYDPKYGWGMVTAAGAVRYRPMIAPRFTVPAGPVQVRAGGQMTVRWDRKGKDYLRYKLAYSSNASAYGPMSANFESGRVGPPLSPIGHAPWVPTRATAAEGAYSARSGAIGDSQMSELRYSARLVGAGTVTFASRVSSEANYDHLDFYIDGRRLLRRSGNAGWSTVSFPVTAGQHTFRWVYSKDYSVGEGLDAAFVDNIKVTNVSQAKWHIVGGLTSAGAARQNWTVPSQPGRDYRFRIRAFNGVKYGVWIYSSGRLTVQ